MSTIYYGVSYNNKFFFELETYPITVSELKKPYYFEQLYYIWLNDRFSSKTIK